MVIYYLLQNVIFQKYNPKLEIDTILGNDIFLSEDYLQLDNDKDEIRRFLSF